MNRALVAYWCERCRRRVCEALPAAQVWCSCGRQAKPLRPGEHAQERRRRARRPEGRVEQTRLAL